MFNKKILASVLFGITMLIYLVVPYTMIARYEKVLHQGRVFRFRPAPVDPYDAFRGKYISLSGINNRIKKDTLVKYAAGEDVYVTVKKNTAGYAYFDDVFKSKPQAPDYILTKVQAVYSDTYHHSPTSEVDIQIPFDRYYLNENYAEKADDVYFRNGRSRDTGSVYLDVRIQNGVAITEELYFNSTPVKEFIQKNMPEKK
jgi:uncharacterized membrane-anchored protein